MCYGCLENALREVVPAVVADQGNAEASPGTVEIFKSAVSTLRSISGWGAVEHPLPAAAQILAVQMQVWCTRTPYAFTAPPPTRMFQFLHNVFIRMSTVEDVNPRNVATPGIGRISECVGELLLQLRDSAAKAHISSSAEIAGHGKGLFVESFAAVLVPAASPAPAPAAPPKMSRQHEAEHLSVGDTVEVSGGKYDGCVGVVERVSPQNVKLDPTVGMLYKHQVHLRAKMTRQHESENFSVGDTPALGRPSSLDSKEGTPSRCTRRESSDDDISSGDSSSGDSGGGGGGDGGAFDGSLVL